MLLNVRFCVDSVPSALTTLFNDLPSTKPARKHFTEVLEKREMARIGSNRRAHLRHTRLRILALRIGTCGLTDSIDTTIP
jgi:hypothetical protein